jgi:hypothetical protein
MSLRSKTVQITGLPIVFSTHSVQNLFEKHGQVQHVVTPGTDYAYVVFNNVNSVDKACSVLDGFDLDGNTITVQVCPSEFSRELESLVSQDLKTPPDTVPSDVSKLCEQLASLSPDLLQTVLGSLQHKLGTSRTSTFTDGMDSYLKEHERQVSNPPVGQIPQTSSQIPQTTSLFQGVAKQLPIPPSQGMVPPDKSDPDCLRVSPPTQSPWFPSPTLRIGSAPTMHGVPMVHNSPFNPGLYQAPRISSFSGESQKSEVSFELWKSEVISLRDAGYSEASILYAIRRSLKGKAADLVLGMGCSVGINQIFDKLQRIFGTVSTPELLLEHYYNSRQMPGETVATWACRLEDMLRKLQEQGCPIASQVVSMLRSKFWSGLQNQLVKNAIRHLHDTNASYEQLLVAARRAELEVNPKVTDPVIARANQSNTQSPSNQMLLDAIVKLNKRIDDMSQRRNSRKDFKGKCFGCNLVGHRKSDCPNKPAIQPPYQSENY